jgi:hypothetical protein
VYIFNMHLMTIFLQTNSAYIFRVHLITIFLQTNYDYIFCLVMMISSDKALIYFSKQTVIIYISHLPRDDNIFIQRVLIFPHPSYNYISLSRRCLYISYVSYDYISLNKQCLYISRPSYNYISPNKMR